MLGLGFRLRPATPGWGVGGCVFVCALRLYPATPGWGVRAWAPVLAAPRHSWLGCWGLCVFVCALRLFPATPGWVCGDGVCAWARGLAAPRYSWLGYRGVCLPVCVARLYPATPGWGLWCAGLVLPGTRSRAVVRCVLSSLPGFAAPGCRCCLQPVNVPWLWPAACLSGVPGGPALVRRASSGSVALGALVSFPDAVVPFPSPGACAPALMGSCAGHAEAGRELGSLYLPLAPAEAGALGSLSVVPVRGPAMGLSLAGPSGVGLGLRALRWFACVDPVTDASGFPYHPSFDGGLGRCTGAVLCGRRLLPLRVPCVRACACPSWPGRAGRPPGRVLVRLTFSLCRLVFLLCWAPSGLGLPLLWFVGCLPPPPPFFLLSVFHAPPLSLSYFGFRPWVPWALAPCFSFLPPPPPPCVFFSLCAPLVSGSLWFPALGALGLGALFLFSPPPPRLVFFFSLCAPLVSGFLWFSAPGALGLGAACCLFCWPPAPRLPLRSRLFCGFCLAVGCSLVVAAPPPPPPPPFCVSLFFSLPLCAPFLERFLVISTLCVCCASPAACCWCRVPAACF